MLVPLATLVLLSVLTGLSVIDLRTHRLPDILTLPLILAGILANGFLFSAWLGSMAGAALGYGSLVLLEVSYRHLRKRDGLGRGDAKLLAAGGAWCGAGLLPYILLLASLAALVNIALVAVLRRRWPDGSEAHAFGPWIALGIALCWIYRIAIPAA